MAIPTCCGNQPTPIIIGLLVTYLTGLIDCYPLYGSSPLSSSSSSSSSPGNMKMGKIVYQSKYNNLPLESSSPLLPVSTSSSSSSLSSSQQVPMSIISSPSASSSSSSSPSSSSSSSSSSSPSASSLYQPLPGHHHHSSPPSSDPAISFVRGPSDVYVHRPIYNDYFDTFRLPLIPTEGGVGRVVGGRGGGGGGGQRIENGFDNVALNGNGLTSGRGNGIKQQKIILSQPSTSPIDFDYIPYIQSDLNPPPPPPPPSPSLSSLTASAASSLGSERNVGDFYEEADYSDPIYDLKYDPIDDLNWLNEPAYRQQQIQPVLTSLQPIIPSDSSSSAYPVYSLPSSTGYSNQNSDELLTNLMVNYLVNELDKNAHSSSQLSSSEPIQHLIRLQQQQQSRPIIEEIKTSIDNMEKKSTLSSFNRDKGSISSASSHKSLGDKKANVNNNQNGGSTIKKVEQRGQKEYPMLRPSTENNGKDDIDNQISLASQLQSLTSSTPIPTTKRSDEEVNQLKSLLQSA